MRPGRVLAGSVLVALGVILLADRLSPSVDAGAILADWWPLAIVAAGVLQMVHSSGSSFSSALVVLLGLLLLAGNLELIPGTGLGAWWPVLLIVLGLRVLYRGTARSRAAGRPGHLDAMVLFSERDLAVPPRWKGGTVTVLFGGATVELAPPGPEGASLDVSAVLGGVEVVVPAEVAVRVSGFPILGAVRDSTGEGGSGPEVRVRATAVLGRVEVRHTRSGGPLGRS